MNFRKYTVLKILDGSKCKIDLMSICIVVEGASVGAVIFLNPKISNPSTLRAQIKGLEPDHSYRFLVWARTQRGRGEPSFIDVETTTSSK